MSKLSKMSKFCSISAFLRYFWRGDVGFTCPPHRQRWFSMLPSASGAWIAHGIHGTVWATMVTMFLPTTTCRSHSYVSSDYLVLLCFIRVSATYSHTERLYFAFLFRAGAHFGFCLFLQGFLRVHLLDCDRCYDFIRFAEVHFARFLFVFPRIFPDTLLESMWDSHFCLFSQWFCWILPFTFAVALQLYCCAIQW